MRVVYVVSTLRNTGPINQLYNIIKNIDKREIVPVIITISKEPKESRLSDFKKLGVTVESLCMPRLAGLFFTGLKLVNVLPKYSPDIIHSQGFRADILVTKLRHFAPIITTIRNFPQKDFVMTYGKVGHIMAILQGWAMKKFTSVVCVSEAVRYNIEKFYNVTRSEVILNGVDTDIYSACSSCQKYQIREKLGLPDNKNIWVVSGHLSNRKNSLFLVKTWKKYFLGDDNNLLIFLGNGPNEQQCLYEAIGCINIKFEGRVSNMHEYFQASDYYISASLAEGMPNAALEAMACGLPVILSNIEPHLEIHARDNEIGEIFDLSNQNSFLESIDNISTSDVDRSKSACINLIDKHFSAELMSHQYQQLYKSIICGD